MLVLPSPRHVFVPVRSLIRPTGGNRTHRGTRMPTCGSTMANKGRHKHAERKRFSAVCQLQTMNIRFRTAALATVVIFYSGVLSGSRTVEPGTPHNTVPLEEQPVTFRLASTVLLTV